MAFQGTGLFHSGGCGLKLMIMGSPYMQVTPHISLLHNCFWPCETYPACVKQAALLPCPMPLPPSTVV